MSNVKQINGGIKQTYEPGGTIEDPYEPPGPLRGKQLCNYFFEEINNWHYQTHPYRGGGSWVYKAPKLFFFAGHKIVFHHGVGYKIEFFGRKIRTFFKKMMKKKLLNKSVKKAGIQVFW